MIANRCQECKAMILEEIGPLCECGSCGAIFIREGIFKGMRAFRCHLEAAGDVAACDWKVRFPLTQDLARVSCKRCKATVLYRIRLAEMGIERGGV